MDETSDIYILSLAALMQNHRHLTGGIVLIKEIALSVVVGAIAPIRWAQPKSHLKYG